MEAIQLESNEVVIKEGHYAPNKDGYDSLFFHPLTRGKNRNPFFYKYWGMELTHYCISKKITYYFFYNKDEVRINVYPNSVIEKYFKPKVKP